MGTGFTVDTPIRVAPFGISSVISLVDDLLLERIRQYYASQYSLEFIPIPRRTPDGRAKRITAYLDLVDDVVRLRFSKIQELPFFAANGHLAENDKNKYFRMLPTESQMRCQWQELCQMPPGQEREDLAASLTGKMRMGSIDVNIMVKLDRANYDASGLTLSDEFADAKAALRGFAQSKVQSTLVLSAGMNQGLYNYISQFQNFYRDALGQIRKTITVKVSDFRSALIQGKFLARKGLEVSEFRIESGLNCGGHAFASGGQMLPKILKELKEKRDQLVDQFRPMVQKYYQAMGWDISLLEAMTNPCITVQGGVGTNGEHRRLLEDYGMDRVGWASPFLLVPEVSPVDDVTRKQLANATENDLYLSDASPLGVPFNNLRGCGSEIWHRERAEQGKPGSPCPKGFLVSNKEFSEKPICTASHLFQRQKMEEIANLSLPEAEKANLREKVLVKACICDHLGNSALIALGIAPAEKSPQAICPGPNIAWFNRDYTLEEMVDHIYGRRESLTPDNRPHMFANEVRIFVDWFRARVENCEANKTTTAELMAVARELEEGMDYCVHLGANRKAYPTENLASIAPLVYEQRSRLLEQLRILEAKAKKHSPCHSE